jgi:branched-chain amino acid transport system ATP-binding protein
MAFLEIRDIDVFYGDVQVVFGLSQDINEGEVVSIIGGNGAGKSTLLRTNSGLMQPSAGLISFEDAGIHASPPEEIVERGVVHVPEGRRLFTLMSVKDNLIVGAYNKRADGDKEATLKEVYSLLPRLKERENQLATTLSGGESRMVAIGRGSWPNPNF